MRFYRDAPYQFIRLVVCKVVIQAPTPSKLEMALLEIVADANYTGDFVLKQVRAMKIRCLSQNFHDAMEE